MNPIKVFLSIFAVGIGLTLILGIIGFKTDLADEGPGDTPQQVSHPAFMSSCINCHGNDLQGMTTAPSIVNLAHLTDEELYDILVNGIGAMPGGMAAGNEEAVIEYLRSIENE
jgi:cytochrome c550